MQAEQLKRVTDYIDNIKAHGGPHQQELADDLTAIIGYYKTPALTPTDDRDETIKNLRDNVAKLIDERDEARDRLATHMRTHGVAKEVAEESHASIKKRSKRA